jgi:hypothetical protein
MKLLNELTDVLFCVACVAFIYHIYCLHYKHKNGNAGYESFIPFSRNLGYASLATHPLGETEDIKTMRGIGKFMNPNYTGGIPSSANYLQDIEEGQEVSESFSCPYAMNGDKSKLPSGV